MSQPISDQRAFDVMDPVLKQALEQSKSARDKLLARTSPTTVAWEPWVDLDTISMPSRQHLKDTRDCFIKTLAAQVRYADYSFNDDYPRQEIFVTI